LIWAARAGIAKRKNKETIANLFIPKTCFHQRELPADKLILISR